MGKTKEKRGKRSSRCELCVCLCDYRYANDAKNIKNHAHINEDPKDAMLRDFQKEIEELRKKLAEGN